MAYLEILLAQTVVLIFHVFWPVILVKWNIPILAWVIIYLCFEITCVPSFFNLQVNPQFYAFRWITLLLTQEFSFEDSLRIWDTLLSDSEGPQACVSFLWQLFFSLTLFFFCLLTRPDFWIKGISGCWCVSGWPWLVLLYYLWFSRSIRCEHHGTFEYMSIEYSYMGHRVYPLSPREEKKWICLLPNCYFI